MLYKLPEESQEDYELFRDFLNLGPRRTLHQLIALKEDEDAKRILRLAKKFDWLGRACEIDKAETEGKMRDVMVRKIETAERALILLESILESMTSLAERQKYTKPDRPLEELKLYSSLVGDLTRLLELVEKIDLSVFESKLENVLEQARKLAHEGETAEALPIR